MGYRLMSTSHRYQYIEDCVDDAFDGVTAQIAVQVFGQGWLVGDEASVMAALAERGWVDNWEIQYAQYPVEV